MNMKYGNIEGYYTTLNALWGEAYTQAHSKNLDATISALSLLTAHLHGVIPSDKLINANKILSETREELKQAVVNHRKDILSTQRNAIAINNAWNAIYALFQILQEYGRIYGLTPANKEGEP